MNIFPIAREARNGARNNIIIFQEITYIQTQILNAISAGSYSVTISDSYMTSTLVTTTNSSISPTISIGTIISSVAFESLVPTICSFSGYLDSVTETFTGSILVATGYYNLSIFPSYGSITGSLDPETGLFNGSINGSETNSSGSLIVSSCSFSGSLNFSTGICYGSLFLNNTDFYNASLFPSVCSFYGSLNTSTGTFYGPIAASSINGTIIPTITIGTILPSVIAGTTIPSITVGTFLTSLMINSLTSSITIDEITLSIVINEMIPPPLYGSGIPYYSTWQGLNPDPSLEDQMNQVIKYFEDYGYNIRRVANISSTAVFYWSIQW
jgi:hypothetical protein